MSSPAGRPGGAIPRARALLDSSRAAREVPAARDLALLGARIGLAWIFVYHGAATLFGAFGGGGIHRQAEYFSSVAHLHPATFFAVLGGIVEFGGGIAVGLGIVGRLAAAGLVGDMAVAMATVTARNGIVSVAAGSGYEINVALGALAFVVAVLGTGRLSLDAALGAVGRRWARRRRPATAGTPAPAGTAGPAGTTGPEGTTG